MAMVEMLRRSRTVQDITLAFLEALTTTQVFAVTVPCSAFKNIRLANIIDAGRVTNPVSKPSLFVAAGNGTDPREWNAILHQDGDEYCNPIATPQSCTATPVLDRPVIGNG